MGAPGLDSETGEEGSEAGETGLLADDTSGLENIRVNSPGPDFIPGAPGLDSETGEAGTGAVETGLLAAGADSLDALPPIELNMRVNAPGPDCDAGASGPGCMVSAPGLDSETGEDGAVEIPTVGSFGGFSIVTGLKTRATSLVRPMSGVPGAPNPEFGPAFDPAVDPALAPAAGTVSACSMRVNSPGLRAASAPAA